MHAQKPNQHNLCVGFVAVDVDVSHAIEIVFWYLLRDTMQNISLLRTFAQGEGKLNVNSYNSNTRLCYVTIKNQPDPNFYSHFHAHKLTV